MKRFISLLLALLLLGSTITFAGAKDGDWRAWLWDDGEVTHVCVVAPQGFVKAAKTPKLLFATEKQPDKQRSVDAQVQQIAFSENGKTADRLRFVANIPLGSADEIAACIISANTVFDKNGDANRTATCDTFAHWNRACEFSARDHLGDGWYADIDTRDTLAVGDTAVVWYENCSAGAELFVNGEKKQTFFAGESQTAELPLTAPGTLTVTVRRGETTLLSRSVKIISSREMYLQNLKDSRRFFDVSSYFENASARSVLFALPTVLAMAFGAFFETLFSFPRIVRG